MEKTKKLIIENLSHQENTFAYFIQEGNFDRVLFNALIKCVYDLNLVDIPKDSRLQIACYIWELAFDISRKITSDFNSFDGYKMENISEEDKIELLNVLFNVANSFNYKKEMDLSLLFL